MLQRIQLTQTNKNDCAITSLKYFESISYNEAFDKFKESYSPRGGTRNIRIMRYLSEKYDCMSFKRGWNHRVISTMYPVGSPNRLTQFDKGITIKTFCEKYNLGIYYILVDKHALVIDNGIVVDSANTKPLKRIKLAWRLK